MAVTIIVTETETVIGKGIGVNGKKERLTGPVSEMGAKMLRAVGGLMMTVIVIKQDGRESTGDGDFRPEMRVP